MMMRRRFQEEMYQLVQDIKEGRLHARFIYCDIAPGAGKSLLSCIIADLIPSHADAIAILTPRTNLAEQAEKDFRDTKKSFLCDNTFEVRLIVGECDNPCGNTRGFVTTYQKATRNSNILAQELRKRRYILVFDEPHHIRDSFKDPDHYALKWKRDLQPLFEAAEYCLFMSGTFERNGNEPIAFLPYNLNPDNPGSFVLDFPSESTIVYNRVSALRDRVIVPVQFSTVDAKGKWLNQAGESVELESFRSGNSQRELLKVVLTTEGALSLIANGIKHWRETQKHYPMAKCIIVAPNWLVARDSYIPYLKKVLNVHPFVASWDDSASNTAIQAFRSQKTGGVLLTVAMAYEGLDSPEITHLICLTAFRSTPWLYQCFARAWRALEWKDECYVYAPADDMMLEAIKRIREEEREAVTMQIPSDTSGGGIDVGFPAKDIVPLSSQATSVESFALDEIVPRHIQVFADELGINPEKVWELLKAKKLVINKDYAFEIPDEMNLTPSEREKRLKAYINDKVVKASHYYERFSSAENPFQAANLELLKAIGKPRGKMRENDLLQAIQYIRRNWPEVCSQGEDDPYANV